MEPNTHPSHPTRAPRVLVVDGEDAVRDTLRTALLRHGFEVYLASTGREGVEIFRRCSAAIDLVLLDAQAADGGGAQTFAALRQVSPEVRCCFMGGDAGTNTAAQLLRLGAHRVFPKPLNLAAVTRVIGQMVGHYGAS